MIGRDSLSIQLRAVIAPGDPETKENAKALSKSGDDLFFSTDANMLFAKGGDTWIALGHVLPVDDRP